MITESIDREETASHLVLRTSVIFHPVFMTKSHSSEHFVPTRILSVSSLGQEMCLVSSKVGPLAAVLPQATAPSLGQLFPGCSPCHHRP